MKFEPQGKGSDQRTRVQPGEVHVWRFALDVPEEALRQLHQTLSQEECSRAERFHFDKDRRHFICARGVLRRLLAGYAGIHPSAIRFLQAQYGKPYLEGHIGPPLRFNLSHSHGFALLAVTHEREVGIDIEKVRPEVATEQIAEEFFSESEVRTLRSLPEGEQTSAFFNCWTRKEAYIKARGEGLSFPLDRFDVSLAPGEPAALLRTADDPAEAKLWRMENIDPYPGYKGAIVVLGHDWNVRGFEWLA